jgi:hypothetical protein
MQSRRLESWVFTRNYPLSWIGSISFVVAALNFVIWLVIGLMSNRAIDGWNNLVGLIVCGALAWRFLLNTAWLRRERAFSDSANAGDV